MKMGTKVTSAYKIFSKVFAACWLMLLWASRAQPGFGLLSSCILSFLSCEQDKYLVGKINYMEVQDVFLWGEVKAKKDGI